MAPFWSPDGRSIGFFADGKLKRFRLDDASVQTIGGSAPVPGGGSWNREGILLYSSNPGSPIWRLDPGGSEPVAATRFEARHQSHTAPVFLPEGRHFLFFVAAPAEERGVHLGRLDTLDSRRLLNSDSPATFAAASRHLLFSRGGRLLTQEFDPVRLQTTGDPKPFGENTDQLVASVSASAAGPIAYRTLPPSAQRHLVWFDRTGKELKRVGYTDRSALGPALSTDGRRIAVFRSTSGNNDIWSYDIARDTWDRLTEDPSEDIYPLWSADGSRLVFGSRRGSMDLFWMLLGAPAGSEERLLSTPEPKFPTDLSPDGRWLLFNVLTARNGMDIWALSLEIPRTPSAVVTTVWNEQHAQLTAVPIRSSAAGSLQPGEPKALFPTIVGSAAPNTNR